MIIIFVVIWKYNMINVTCHQVLLHHNMLWPTVDEIPKVPHRALNTVQRSLHFQYTSRRTALP